MQEDQFLGGDGGHIKDKRVAGGRPTNSSMHKHSSNYAMAGKRAKTDVPQAPSKLRCFAATGAVATAARATAAAAASWSA